MALSRADHKRIALTVAREIGQVLADHHGRQLVERHRARKAGKTEAPPPELKDDEIEAFTG